MLMFGSKHLRRLPGQNKSHEKVLLYIVSREYSLDRIKNWALCKNKHPEEICTVVICMPRKIQTKVFAANAMHVG